MMKRMRIMAKTDLIIGGILMILLLFSDVSSLLNINSGMILGALVLQFFLGVWQVLLGIIGAVMGSRWRQTYLIYVFFYFLLGGIGLALVEAVNFGNAEMFGITLAILYGLVLPQGIGIYYITQAYKDLERYPSEKEEARLDEFVLDADFDEFNQ